MVQDVKGKAESRYQELRPLRETYLRKARECAKVTLPMLFPPDGHSGSTSYPTPFQALGAYGVNNLASKLLLTLLPPTQPCFRLEVDELILNRESPPENFRAELEEAFSVIERAVMKRIEMSGDRVPLGEMLPHLLVGGNVLLYKDATQGLRVFHLDRYVVKRDPMGKPLEIVVHEEVAPASLDPEFYERIKERIKGEGTSIDRTVNIYTYVYRTPKEWRVYQECYGEVVPESEGTYPLDACPWFPLRMFRIDGEDYGRSYVEQYLGDLQSLEGLTQAILEGSAAAARLLILVRPGGSTDADSLANTPNGGIVEGNADDVSVFQLQKQADFRVTLETIQMIMDRLSRAFLLNSAVRRNAERVTAEEIRYMAAELEDALGGVYTLLSQEFQLPYIKVHLKMLEKEGLLPKLPEGVVNPTIITGVDALSRTHDRNKLVGFLQTLAAALTPELAMHFINPTEAIRRLATAEGIDTKGLLRTEEELAQEQQAAQMQALVSQLGPDAMRLIGQTMLQKGGGMDVSPQGEGAPA
mgnify:FL=1